MHGYGFRIKDVNVNTGVTHHVNMNMRADGKVYMATNEEFQGTYWMEANAMVIAEELGAKLEDVVVYYEPNDLEWQIGTSRNRGAGCSWAAKEATVQLKANLLTTAAASGLFGSGVTAAQLDTQNSTVYLKSDPTKNFPFQSFVLTTSVVTGSPSLGVNTIAADFIGHPTPPPSSGAPGAWPTMNAIFCEVAVDTQTGQVEVLDWVAAVDAGKVIRPSSFEAQTEQPCINMTGDSLRGELIRDPATGVLLNGSSLQYMPNTILDIPPINIVTIESRMGTGCYGGNGNAHYIYDHDSLPLAVYNAIGKWIDPPITPDKVLAALGQIPVSSVRTTGGIGT